MAIKFVVIIQCEISRRRCSGWACTKSFYDREGFFKDKGYGGDARYLAMTCGGCCGGSVASLLEHFSKKMTKQAGIKKDEVAVHISSCAATENYHHKRCPNLEYMRGIIEKKGYRNIVEGTYLSANAAKRREAGIYGDGVATE